MNDVEINYFTWSVINTTGVVIAFGFDTRKEATEFKQNANDRAYDGCTIELISKTLIDRTYFKDADCSQLNDSRAGTYNK